MGQTSIDIETGLGIRTFLSEPHIVPLIDVKALYKIGDNFKVGATILAQQDRTIKVASSSNTTERIFGIPIAFGNDTSE